MRKILKNSNETPEAVFAVTDRMAVGALRLMKEKGLKVPEDIAIAGIGASEISRYIEPSLTTVEYQNEKAGIEAAQWMLKLVENEKISEKLRKLDYRLIVRDSL
ncbi:MAG TPA: substrate-binding domain-containing protein [Bacillaceae bacterium]